MDAITIERKPQFQRHGRSDTGEWRVWTRAAGEVTRCYGGEETCYFLEGFAVITAEREHPLEIDEGDLVTIAAGTSCRWEIRKSIRALYHSEPLFNLLI